MAKLQANLRRPDKDLTAAMRAPEEALDADLPGTLVIGLPGENGGYYLVEAEQLDINTLRLTFTASKDDMPDVDPVDITLPGVSDEQITDAVNKYLDKNPVVGQPGADGKDGQDGSPGKDGTSPIVTVSAITGGHRITITDASGTKTLDVLNGADGKDGEPGKDGLPGKDGADGKDGVSATHSWNGTILTVTSSSGTSSADLKGEKGDKGATGPMGPQGEKGETGAPGADGKDGADGQPGKDGYTPIKGTDYFTEADKTAMVADVIAALPVYDGEVLPL